MRQRRLRQIARSRLPAPRANEFKVSLERAVNDISDRVGMRSNSSHPRVLLVTAGITRRNRLVILFEFRLHSFGRNGARIIFTRKGLFLGCQLNNAKCLGRSRRVQEVRVAESNRTCGHVRNSQIDSKHRLRAPDLSKDRKRLRINSKQRPALRVKTHLVNRIDIRRIVQRRQMDDVFTHRPTRNGGQTLELLLESCHITGRRVLPSSVPYLSNQNGSKAPFFSRNDLRKTCVGNHKRISRGTHKITSCSSFCSALKNANERLRQDADRSAIQFHKRVF